MGGSGLGEPRAAASQEGAQELIDRRASVDGVWEGNPYDLVRVKPQVKCLAFGKM